MARQLRSTITSGGQLELSLIDVETPAPGPDQVVVRVEAAPINPSDLGLLLGPADMSQAQASGSPDHPIVTAPIPAQLLPALADRFDEPMAAGNEGAGVVVEAGSSDAAQALLGKTVALLAREMYAQFRVVDVAQCLVLREGTTSAEGASCFVNPLTVLGMVETMRLEGHTALVHTAAASNLGVMLQKVCTDEGIDLVNIVRRPQHVELLRGIGARYVCDTSAPSFEDDLRAALTETGATLAFDATGGGRLATQILSGMEAAAMANAPGFNRYGSSVHKQVYIYGGLDTSPTVLHRNFGLAWGLGGWLLTPFLERVGPEAAERLRQRVADEVTTTFASHYAKEISLAEVLEPGAHRGLQQARDRREVPRSTRTKTSAELSRALAGCWKAHLCHSVTSPPAERGESKSGRVDFFSSLLVRALRGHDGRHALHAAEGVDLAAVAVEVAHHVQRDGLADALGAVSSRDLAIEVCVGGIGEELRGALEDGLLVAAEGVDVGDVDLLRIFVRHARADAVEGQAGPGGPLFAPELGLPGDAADDQVFDPRGVPETPGDRVAALLRDEVKLLVGAVAGVDQCGVREV